MQMIKKEAVPVQRSRLFFGADGAGPFIDWSIFRLSDRHAGIVIRGDTHEHEAHFIRGLFPEFNPFWRNARVMGIIAGVVKHSFYFNFGSFL